MFGRLVNDFINYFSSYPSSLATILLSMLPVTESRVAVPLAITFFGLSPIMAIIYSTLGGAITTIILINLLDWVTTFLIKHFRIFDNFFTWLFKRTRNRFTAKYEKYGLFALVLFVAAPIPGSGVWVGSLAAYLFNIDKKKSFIFIVIGAIIASSIMALITVGALEVTSGIN